METHRNEIFYFFCWAINLSWLFCYCFLFVSSFFFFLPFLLFFSLPSCGLIEHFLGFHFYLFQYLFLNFYCGIVDLQQQSESVIHIHIYIFIYINIHTYIYSLFFRFFPIQVTTDLLRSLYSSILCYTVDPYQLSIFTYSNVCMSTQISHRYFMTFEIYH